MASGVANGVPVNGTSSGPDGVPTRETLLGLLDDIELISKELIENSVLPKQKKMSGADHDALTQLLVDKDRQLKQTMALATQQGQVEKKIQALSVEVKKQDDAIKELQKKFKEAETLLSTAIFQANQKLDSIGRAKEAPVASEELIKYAHRISASNAVCAPLNWQQGDPRRPYPTDMEMRCGFLGRPELANIPMSGGGGATPATAAAAAATGGGGGSASVRDAFHLTSPHPTQHQQMPPGTAAAAGPSGPTPAAAGGMMQPGLMSPVGASGGSSRMQAPAAVPPPPPPPVAHPSAGQFAWQGGEMSINMKDGSSVPIETAGGGGGGAAGGGDVDVMSTDSSSSSSTDSN